MYNLQDSIECPRTLKKDPLREARLQNFLWVHAPGTLLQFITSKPPLICQDKNISFLQAYDYQTTLSCIESRNSKCCQGRPEGGQGGGNLSWIPVKGGPKKNYIEIYI